MDVRMIKNITLNDKQAIEELAQLRYLMQFDEKAAGVNMAKLVKDKELIIQNTIDYIKDNLNQNLFIFVYLIDNTIVATASLIMTPMFPSWHILNGKKGIVSNVYTKPPYRQHGYQSALIKQIIAKAEQLNISTLTVNTYNEVALRLYHKFGFQKYENTYRLNL